MVAHNSQEMQLTNVRRPVVKCLPRHHILKHFFFAFFVFVVKNEDPKSTQQQQFLAQTLTHSMVSPLSIRGGYLFICGGYYWERVIPLRKASQGS